jgi:hypothetical protein
LDSGAREDFSRLISLVKANFQQVRVTKNDLPGFYRVGEDQFAKGGGEYLKSILKPNKWLGGADSLRG